MTDQPAINVQFELTYPARLQVGVHQHQTQLTQALGAALLTLFGLPSDLTVNVRLRRGAGWQLESINGEVVEHLPCEPTPAEVRACLIGVTHAVDALNAQAPVFSRREGN